MRSTRQDSFDKQRCEAPRLRLLSIIIVLVHFCWLMSSVSSEDVEIGACRHDPPFIIVRSAYYDDRARRLPGEHKEAVTFLFEVNRAAANQFDSGDRDIILGCRVEAPSDAFPHRIVSVSSQLTFVHMKWGMRHHLRHNPNQTHSIGMLDCYNVRAFDGARASLFVVDDDGQLCEAVSEQPLYVPRPRLGRVVACGAVWYGRPPWLKEWIAHLKAIGVDHMQAYVSKGLLDDVDGTVRRAVEEGFMSVREVREILNSSQIAARSHHLWVNDCMYRHRGQYDYAMLADSDDFFVPPRIPDTSDYGSRHGDILDMIERSPYACARSCRFPWINHFPKCLLRNDTHQSTLFPERAPIRQNPPHDLLSSNNRCKSIVNTSEVVVMGLHHVVRQVSEEAPNYGEWSEAGYVSHMQVRFTPKGGCNRYVREWESRNETLDEHEAQYVIAPHSEKGS